MPHRRSSRLHAVASGAVLIAITMAACVGCKPGHKGPATAPVTGVVTFNGEPVSGATIAFQPGEGGRSAAGITDASGRYQLSTYARNDGAVPGDYKVVIVKYDDTPSGSGTGKDYVPPDGPIPEPKSLIPKKYASGESSGLKATVATGQNTLDFTLAP